jgi:hypothetical protein
LVGFEADPYQEEDEDAIANRLWKSLMEKTRFRKRCCVPVLRIKLPVDQSYRSFHNINELLYIHVSGFLEIWFHTVTDTLHHWSRLLASDRK